MTNERMNVIVAAKSKDGTKTSWRTIGSAWPRDVAGFSVELFAMLAAQDGAYRMLIVAKDSITSRPPSA